MPGLLFCGCCRRRIGPEWFSGLTNDFSASSSPAAQTVVAAVIGGTISRARGGKFANGAITGAFQFAMGRAIEKSAYLATGPDIGIGTDPTPDNARSSRLKTFYEGMAASESAGIVFGEGTVAIYIDSYAYLQSGNLLLCSRDCQPISVRAVLIWAEHFFSMETFRRATAHLRAECQTVEAATGRVSLGPPESCRAMRGFGRMCCAMASVNDGQ